MEKAIAYIRSSFYAARDYRDLDDLNAQAEAWCSGIASQRRCPSEPTLTVEQAWEQECSHLQPGPALPFCTDEREEVRVAKTPYVRFDGNDYSVPPSYVQRTLVVLASPQQVRILQGNEVLAVHTRSYSKNEQIEDPQHIQTLVEHKRQARRHRGIDRLERAAPKSRDLLVRLAQRGQSLASATAALLRLLELYGAEALDSAIGEALDKDAPHPHSVQLVLERKAHEKAAPPRLPLSLPDDPRVRDLNVRPHELTDYDPMTPEDEPESDDE